FNVNSFEDLESIYTEAQPYIQDWVNHTSTQLKEKLYTTSRLLDLDAIIIGGGLPKRVIQSIHNCINSATFLPPEDELPCPDIICSDIGPKVNVYGAALVPIYRECFPT
ncbi:hypothetical protein, partial [Enterococcus faecium]|uniref:hypothetical protein n=1 Tax=Enterococcus faecium TaxID=1352 RepID=UPI0034E97ACE